MSIIYANEKLHKVIHALTTGEDAIVDRLRKAGQPYLAFLSEDSFPQDVKPLWAEISEAFKEDMQQQNLTVEKAVQIVNKLLLIKFELETAVNKRSSNS